MLVLILGAGASKPYGFPVGSELRSTLIKLDPKFIREESNYISRCYSEAPHPLRMDPDEVIRKRKMELGVTEDIWNRIGLSSVSLNPEQSASDAHANSFAQTFKYSGWRSIDAFLSHRVDYSGFGKKAIAAAIQHYEHKSTLEEWDWYGELWSWLSRYLIRDADGIRLKEIPIRIISFNYDRSLEYYLWNAIQHTFNIDESEAFAIVSNIDIFHFYGSLGPLYGPGSVPYGMGSVDFAAQNIRVIPYERHGGEAAVTDEAQSKVRDTIAMDNAKIVYMGFGFDEQNCNLLGLEHIRKTSKVYGTTLGLTQFERRRVGNRFFNLMGPSDLDAFIEEEYGCIDIIKNKPILI